MLRPTLNGQFVFQIGTLDQGFWPDGVYTAPTDAALAFDLQKHKDLGFNMVRKHIKVEPQRWFYHADRLGLLVWQDIPSLTAQNIDPTNAQQAQFETEAREIVDEHRSSPGGRSPTSPTTRAGASGRWPTPQRVGQNIKNQDPTRLVNAHSGYNCCQSLGNPGNGDIIDWHIYVGPDSPTAVGHPGRGARRVRRRRPAHARPRVQPERQLPRLRVAAQRDRAHRPVRRPGRRASRRS